jgi:hypothetical protein
VGLAKVHRLARHEHAHRVGQGQHDSSNVPSSCSPAKGLPAGIAIERPERSRNSMSIGALAAGRGTSSTNGAGCDARSRCSRRDHRCKVDSGTPQRRLSSVNVRALALALSQQSLVGRSASPGLGSRRPFDPPAMGRSIVASSGRRARRGSQNAYLERRVQALPGRRTGGRAPRP